MIESRVLTQHERFVHRKTVEVSELSHNLSLLHRVNSEFSLQVLIQLNEICWITSMLYHDFDDFGCNVSIRGDDLGDYCRIFRGWLYSLFLNNLGF